MTNQRRQRNTIFAWLYWWYRLSTWTIGIVYNTNNQPLGKKQTYAISGLITSELEP